MAGACRSTITALALKFAREGVFSDSVSDDAIQLDLVRYREALFETCEKRPAIRSNQCQFRLILVLTIAFSAFAADMKPQDLPEKFAKLFAPKQTPLSHSQFSLGSKVPNPNPNVPQNLATSTTTHTISPTMGLHNK